MSQISRLKSAEITNGNLIDADDLGAELDQLVSESNDQDTRVTAVESGTVTLTGVKSFASAPKMDSIAEKTTDAGVTVDGVLLKDGTVSPSLANDPGSPSDGQIWHNSTDHLLKAQLDGSTKTIATADAVGLPTGFISHHVPNWTSVSSITVPSGLTCRSADNTVDMTVASDINVSLASSGAAGLDTGTEANSTWYYLWLCKGSSGVTAVLSASSSAPTLPSGYDSNKRRLPIAFYNNSSGDLLECVVASGWPARPQILFPNKIHQPLSGGTAISYTTLTLMLPTGLSRMAMLSCVGNRSGNAGELWIRSTASSGAGRVVAGGPSDKAYNDVICPTNSSAQIDYKNAVSGAAADIHVVGYIATEVA